MVILIIKGGEGSGKTTLAERIAGFYGSYKVASQEEFESNLAMERILETVPDTVVIDEVVDPSVKFFDRIRRYANAERIELAGGYVKPPHFIVCTNLATRYGVGFSVIELPILGAKP